MTLQNLLGRSLDANAPDKSQNAKLLAAAQRNIQDAQLSALSAENRFDAAYKAIMQLSMAALQAHGYRTLTSKPGHHQTTLQCLTHTLGVSPATVRVLDALRKQRNLSDYDGELVTEQALREFDQTPRAGRARRSGSTRNPPPSSGAGPGQ